MSDNGKKQDEANTIKLDISFNKSHEDIKLIGLVVFGLALNLICGKIISLTGLPFYFDCIGTIAAAIIGGFMPAVLVGFFTNIISSMSDSSNLYYGILNVLIAIVAAGFAQKKYFKKLSFKMLLPYICFVLIGGGLGSVITWGLYGNTMGDELASSLAGRIYTNVVQNAFWAQMYAGLIMDLPDKLISVILAFIIYKVYPKKIKPQRDNINPHTLAQRGISLSGKIIICVLLIFSIAAAVVTYVSFNQFRDTLVASEAQYATDTARFAATLIDGDNVDEYLRRKDSAEGYFRIKRYYSLIWNSSDRIQYLYVYQIREDGCHVVFDVDTPDTPGSETGTVIPFDESFGPYIEDLLAGREIEPIITDDTYGWLLSSYVPVYDSNNRCKCYVCVDVAMPNIADIERTFTFKIATILLGFLITVLTLSIYLAKRFIVSPVNSLAKLASDFAYTNDEARKETLDSIRNLEIKTGDEIEHLYNAMAKTTRDTVDYINESQRKNEAISTFQSGMINVMADLVESRDQSTGEHIKNTSAYVEIICDELIKEGKFADILDEEFKNNIVSSAPMHDIGKIKISDTILNKPGKFTDEEYEIMKTHAEEGAKIIRTVKKTVDNQELKENYLGEAENMAHYHHEKWNGKGYPCGLKGEEIPLSARIMAVADVFDALVAVRVYKPAMPFEKAISIIKESSGEHFDPVIVEAFLNAEDRIRAVTSKLH
ncbi:MAG: HD domain-containing protein [Lachnospiraceae bacterium]|nr:HD domain-containing protein [Lachnospiraceae bacterium]